MTYEITGIYPGPNFFNIGTNNGFINVARNLKTDSLTSPQYIVSFTHVLQGGFFFSLFNFSFASVTKSILQDNDCSLENFIFCVIKRKGAHYYVSTCKIDRKRIFTIFVFCFKSFL